MASLTQGQVSRTANHRATTHLSTGLQLLPLSLGLYQPLLSPCFHSCPHTLALHTAAGGSVSTYPGGCCPPATLALLQRPGHLLSALPGTLFLHIFPWLIPLPSPLLGLFLPTTFASLWPAPRSGLSIYCQISRPGPEKPLNTRLAIILLRRPPAPTLPRTPSLQPKVTLTCRRPMKSEPTTFLEQTWTTQQIHRTWHVHISAHSPELQHLHPPVCKIPLLQIKLGKWKETVPVFLSHSLNWQRYQCE